MNVSPVNFWMPDVKKFPLYKDAIKQIVNLEPGDCVFMPAYYYYHLQGFRQYLPSAKDVSLFDSFPKEWYAKNETNMDLAKGELYSSKMGSLISLKFSSNSKLLDDFFLAVEMSLIK